jgi:antitoxin (DNA-binding transcriptional repressor) of toxin-antitoxin stability system
METFSIRDLRERTGERVRTAEAGELSVVAKHGQPVFVAVPFSDLLLQQGINAALAVKLFRDRTVSMGRAAKLAGMNKVAFIRLLGAQGIAAVEHAPSELDDELALLGEQ